MTATVRRVVIVASAVAAFALASNFFAEGEEVAPPPAGVAEAAGEIAAEVEQEKVLKEQEKKIEAQKHFESGSEALQKRDYELCILELKAAVAADPENEQYKEVLKDARVMQINHMLKEGSFAEAKLLCDGFLQDYPGDTRVADFQRAAEEGLEKLAAGAEEKEAEEEKAAAVPSVDEKEAAAQLVKEADDLILKKDYERARGKLEEAYKLNPYDVDIHRKIKRVEREITRYARARYDTMKDEMLRGVYEAWSVRPRRVIKPGMVEAGPTVPEPTEERKEIFKKLNQIIPEVKFEDAKLREVVDYLMREADVNIVIDPVVFTGYQRPATSVEAMTGLPGGMPPTTGGPTMEPSGFPGAEGTTIGPSGELIGPGGALTPESAVPGGPPRMGEGLGPSVGWVAPVTDVGIKLNLKNVPLKAVLKYVLRYKNLKYVVEDYAIVIVPIDYVPPESMETEIFRLSATGMGLIQRPGLGTTGAGLESGPTGFPGGSSMLSGPSPLGGGAETTSYFGPEAAQGTAQTIEDYLRKSGVPWPMGSNIQYIATTGHLIVTNTPTNLVLVREMVHLFDQPALQVAIEAIFVELIHTRWYENSFQIGMTSPMIFTQGASGPTPSGTRKTYEMGVFPQRMTRFLPELPMEEPFLGDDRLFAFQTKMTEPEFEFVWHALDQSDWSELLSAPRVTTISGQQAVIEVVREITYPTEYDTETINIGGGWGTSVDVSGLSGEVFMVTPGNWEKRDVGIILNVTPTVSADGELINLVLLPEVTDLVDWINYGNDIYPIMQPVFETRNVTTSIHVNDGETIVLGGLITDKTATYEDKVPFLGSIPFLGRFFRTEAEMSAKANLIIFVTAKLITSRGTELKVERGLIEERWGHLEGEIEKIRESKEEAGELSPGVGSAGVIE